MKKLGFLTVVLLIVTVHIFSESPSGRDFIADRKSMDELRLKLYTAQKMQQCEIAFESFVWDRVTKRFRIAFIRETRSQELNFEERLCLMAMVITESDNWRVLESNRPNKNGSVDRGPLGFNEPNLRNPQFVKAFVPPRNLYEDKEVWHMVICIRFFHDLYKSYGLPGALVAYNAGPNAWIYQNIPSSTENFYVPEILGDYSKISYFFQKELSRTPLPDIGSSLEQYSKIKDLHLNSNVAIHMISEPRDWIALQRVIGIDNRQKLSIVVRKMKAKVVSWVNATSRPATEEESGIRI
jgi:hypothetical protein